MHFHLETASSGSQVLPGESSSTIPLFYPIAAGPAHYPHVLFEGCTSIMACISHIYLHTYRLVPLYVNVDPWGVKSIMEIRTRRNNNLKARV